MTERSVLPRVAMPRGGLSGAAIAIGAVVAGLALFGVLDARRRSLTAPAVMVRNADLGPSEAPPALYVPPEPTYAPPPVRLAVPAPAPLLYPPAPRREPPPKPPQQEDNPQLLSPPPQQPAQERPRNSSGSTIVLDSSEPRSAAEGGTGATASPLGTDANGTAGRARAGAIANRTTTVPQGTLIPAVLETAFNSTRAGFARALVQRDVRGFDGKRVLIPRGSRLIGEYRADTTQGQNRALIAWTRLIRPDGVTIAIGSPATDPVGTGGIKARVNSHFFSRFGGAILQSTLDIGVNLAPRSTNSPVIVALPGTVQTTTTPSLTRSTEIPPTLSVRQGTSVSVFVARDLDFTEVETRQ